MSSEPRQNDDDLPWNRPMRMETLWKDYEGEQGWMVLKIFQVKHVRHDWREAEESERPFTVYNLWSLRNRGIESVSLHCERGSMDSGDYGHWTPDFKLEEFNIPAFIPGQGLTVDRNQGRRDAVVLANLEGHALIEYEMPNERTFLNIIPQDTLRNGGTEYRTVSYNKVPKKWLREIVASRIEWTGRLGPGYDPLVKALRTLYAKRPWDMLGVSEPAGVVLV